MIFHKLVMSLHQERFGIVRLKPDATLPDWAHHGPFVSITRTEEELSIVTPESVIPRDLLVERGWRCLEVEGELDFALTGVLVSLLAPLADAGISIFAVSTFNTDYVLVKDEVLEQACSVLADAGHTVQPHP